MHPQPHTASLGSIVLALLCTLGIAGTTGCGSTATSGESTSSSSTQGAGGAGGSGGMMGQGGGGASFDPGQGGGSCIPETDNSAALLINGQPAVNAQTLSVVIAPGFGVGLCFEHMPPDLPGCPHTLSIDADPVLGEAVPATAFATVFGEVMESGPGGFTLTLTSQGETWGGTYEGTITGATQNYVLSGSFDGCPSATE